MAKMSPVCGEQLSEKAITRIITHRCVKTVDEQGEHLDGQEAHRCYCSKIYRYSDAIRVDTEIRG